MIVLLDSNIVLDVMLPNPELFEESNAVMELAVKGFDFYISASAVTDIYYIAKKSCHSSEATKETIKNLLRIVSVAESMRLASSMPWILIGRTSKTRFSIRWRSKSRLR